LGFGEPHNGPALTLEQLRHMFAFMKVSLSNEELQEVMAMLDDNQDGKVTQEGQHEV
jgi:Ca2+-binding EF-hand superfamily protein